MRHTRGKLVLVAVSVGCIYDSGALVHPIDVEQALRKGPRAIRFLRRTLSHRAKGGKHQTSLSIGDRYVVREAVGLTGLVGCESEDRALSDEMGGRFVL